jgi:hypothetical protein
MTSLILLIWTPPRRRRLRCAAAARPSVRIETTLDDAGEGVVTARRRGDRAYSQRQPATGDSEFKIKGGFATDHITFLSGRDAGAAHRSAP